MTCGRAQSFGGERHRRVDHSPFGGDRFGRMAEGFARAFGTPAFIAGQTLLVVAWIALNSLAATSEIRWDRPWFVLLNLLFSTQAAYAAPLILLAQTRQADRDKHRDEIAERHREQIAGEQNRMLCDIHHQVCAVGGEQGPKP